MQIIVSDDVVDRPAADAVEQFFASPQFPWYFYANVNFGSKPPEDRPGAALRGLTRNLRWA